MTQALDREKTRLLRFLVSGGLSVATDLGVFVALQDGLGVAQAPAKGVSYVTGMALGFVLNKAWTFGSRRDAKAEAPSYLLLYAITLGVNVLAYGAVLDLSQHKPAAFLVATGLTTVLNYLGLRFMTFRRGIAEREQTETPR